MPDIVESDFAVQQRASAYTTNVLNNPGIDARLFTAPGTIDPSLTAGSFTEATYGSYTLISIAGYWPAPTQVVPGQYVSTTAIITFAANSGAPQTVLGCFVTDTAGNLTMSFLFASPVVMPSGGPPLLVQISYNWWARILLP